MTYLINLRNFLVRTFNSFLSGIIVENKIYKLWFFKIIPLNIYSFIFYFLKYDYFYRCDGVYFYSVKCRPSIIPIIYEAKCSVDDKTIDMIHIFSKYQNNFPLWIILENENIRNTESLDVKLINNGQIIDYSFDIDQIRYLNIKEIIKSI